MESMCLFLYLLALVFSHRGQNGLMCVYVVMYSVVGMGISGTATFYPGRKKKRKLSDKISDHGIMGWVSSICMFWKVCNDAVVKLLDFSFDKGLD